MNNKKIDKEPAAPELSGNHSKIFRHSGSFSWEGIEPADYKAAGSDWQGITRRELIGKRGESPAFHVRYFEIAPGGFSTLEQHEHEHTVIPLRGHGEVQLGREFHHVGFGDVIYIAPNDTHQLRNPASSDEPFGFICIVNAQRDKPVAVQREEP